MVAVSHLSTRLIARAVDELQSWRLPEDDDVPGLHRGVLKVLLATDSLTGIDLPRDMLAPRFDDADAMLEWSVIAGLLDQAEASLISVTHRSRVARLHGTFPGHAAQLERLRRKAATHVRMLRVRVDFVCRGSGEVHVPKAEPAAPRSTSIQ
jgi:hypothetical protein